jgi:hypothetical protein
MKLVSASLPPSRPLKPLCWPGLEGIEVLPYIRGRLVFAELTARLWRQGSYQSLLVDLPSFMNHSGWLTEPLQFLPALSLAVFESRDGHPRALFFTPNDAATIGAYLALAEKRPVYCVDDRDLLNYPAEALMAPAISTGDDYRVYSLGLEAFFRPFWEQMDRVWAAASRQQKEFTLYRAGVMARQIHAAGPAGQKALLLCDYQLYWALQQARQEKSLPRWRYLFQWGSVPGVLQVEDPYFAWAHGLLDDYPAVTLAFWNSMHSPRAESFDKARVLEEIAGEILTGPRERRRSVKLADNVIALQDYRRARGLPRVKQTIRPTRWQPAISVRSLITFRHYLHNLLVTSQRLLPEPGSQLFHAAQACGGRALHKGLAEGLLHYPNPVTKEQLHLILKRGKAVLVGGPGLELPDFDRLYSWYSGRALGQVQEDRLQSALEMEYDVRRQTLDLMHPVLTAVEQRTLDRGGEGGSFIRWEVIEDFQHQAQACAQVQWLAQLRQQHGSPQRSWGSLAGGIHWKATLAARARGEEAIYVKPRNFWSHGQESLNEHTPVVFLLAPADEIDRSWACCVHDSNAAQRRLELGDDETPADHREKLDQVYSVFLASKATHQLLSYHVQQEDLTALATLYSKALGGVERYQAITRQPTSRQCRLSPRADPELACFPLSQRLVAWAVKYAQSQVIVAAAQGWQPPALLAEFARRKGVRLQIVSLAGFRPEFLERLGRNFFLSTELKRHPRHAEISRRFIY